MKGSYRAVFVWKDNPNIFLSTTFNSTDIQTATNAATTELGNLVGSGNVSKWSLGGIININLTNTFVQQQAA